MFQASTSSIWSLISIWIISAFLNVEAAPQPHESADDGSRIVGGYPVKQGEIPYQLALLDKSGDQICGACLVEHKGLMFALTAAHCVRSFFPEQILLVAGELNLNDTTGIEQTREVADTDVHKFFNPYTWDNDIAILYLDQPFELNENVQPIALPEKDFEPTGDLLVSGWGKTSLPGRGSDVLMAVVVPVVDIEACRAAYADVIEVEDTHICAGFLGTGEKDACNGDSGGPARSIEGNYLAGIVSTGEGCAEPDYPGIYANVPVLMDWVEERLDEHLGNGGE